MAEGIRALCLVSVLCGAAVSLCPEGGVKRIMAVLTTALLLMSLINPIKAQDLTLLAEENARLREREAELSLKGGEINQRLSRLVIQDECEAYIMDKAAELGLNCKSIKLEAEWSSEGFWVPWSLSLEAEGEKEKLERLQSICEAELGIPAERQYMSGNE